MTSFSQRITCFPGCFPSIAGASDNASSVSSRTDYFGFQPVLQHPSSSSKTSPLAALVPGHPFPPLSGLHTSPLCPPLTPTVASSTEFASPAVAVAAAGLLAARGWAPDAAAVHAAAALMEQRVRRTGELRAALHQLAAANEAAACLPLAAAAMTAAAVARLKVAAFHHHPGGGCAPSLPATSTSTSSASVTLSPFQVGLERDPVQCCPIGLRPSSRSSTGAGDILQSPSLHPAAVTKTGGGLSTLFHGHDDDKLSTRTSCFMPHVI
jgi:hypothetical protein